MPSYGAPQMSAASASGRYVDPGYFAAPPTPPAAPAAAPMVAAAPPPPMPAAPQPPPSPLRPASAPLPQTSPMRPASTSAQSSPLRPARQAETGERYAFCNRRVDAIGRRYADGFHSSAS